MIDFLVFKIRHQDKMVLSPFLNTVGQECHAWGSLQPPRSWLTRRGQQRQKVKRKQGLHGKGKPILGLLYSRLM